MTNASTTHDPGAVAELAAEAARTLKRLTLVPPSAGTPEWEDVGDVCRAIVESALRSNIYRKRSSNARIILNDLEAGEPYRADTGTAATSELMVSTAAAALDTARFDAARAIRRLAEAQEAVAHLCPLIEWPR